MADLMRLGANIRGLRTAFGESQEELGAAIFVEKNTVSYYESGKRAPSKETLSAIAKHFAVSVDDLLFGDYGFTEKLRFELNYFWRNIRIFLPIISSDAALSNQFFRKTFESHSAMYDKLEEPHEDAFRDMLEPLFGCLDNYLAITDENCTVEAAANYLSLWYLLLMLVKATPMLLINRPAFIVNIAKEYHEVKEAVDEIDSSFEDESAAFLQELEDEEAKEIVVRMIRTVKRSKNYSDLADYYLALQYTWNLVDNDLGYGVNQRVGLEMMHSFKTVENKYAKRYIKAIFNSTKG